MEEKYRTSYSEYYYDIAKDNFIKFLNLTDDYKKALLEMENISKMFDEEQRNEDSKNFDLAIDKLSGIKYDMDVAGHITIIFSAMCLESIINQYAISRKSNKYFDNYLDKLNVKAKWVIIPKLLANAEFDCSSQAFELLDGVIKLRNDLVHYKSRIVIYGENQKEQIQRDEVKFRTDVQNSFKSIFSVTKELKRIDRNWEEYKCFIISPKDNPEIKKYI